MYSHVLGWMFIPDCLPRFQRFFGERRCVASQGASGKYRTDRPTLMNGGPSPRMRALASQERLTLRSLAVSSAVNRAGKEDSSSFATMEGDIFKVIFASLFPKGIQQAQRERQPRSGAASGRVRRLDSDVDRPVTWRGRARAAYAPK